MTEKGDRLLAAGLVLLGLVVLLAATYPVHKYPADADALLNGLCACEIGNGHVRLFFAGARLGALECYPTALFFLLFGVSRASLGLTAPLIGTLTLIVAFLLFRELFDRKIALVATLLFAVPAPFILFWLSMPNSYPTMMLLCTTVLWIAARIARRGATRWSLFALGLATGLGFWHNFLILTCSIPALVLVAWKGPRKTASALIVASGMLLGALPWIAFNVRYPLATFRGNYGSMPAQSAADMLSNLRYTAAHKVPELVASTDPEGGRSTGFQRVLRIPLLLLYLGAVGWLLIARRYSCVPRETWLLLVGIILAVFLVNTVSLAGQFRVLTVRYVFPLWFVAVSGLASLVVALSRRSRVAAMLVVALVLLFNVAGYQLPGQPYRTNLERQAAADAHIAERLTERRIGLVVGTYWDTYPLMFLTRGRVAAVPCNPYDDLYNTRGRVGTAHLRWMAIERGYDTALIGARMEQASVAGSTHVIEPYVLFEARDPALADRALATCP